MSTYLVARRAEELARHDFEMRRLFKSLGTRQNVLDKAIKHAKKVIRASQPVLSSKVHFTPTH
jgi:hypothetical protein